MLSFKKQVQELIDTGRFSQSDLLHEFDEVYKEFPHVHEGFYRKLYESGIIILQDNATGEDVYRVDNGQWRRVDECFCVLLHTFLADNARRDFSGYGEHETYLEARRLLQGSKQVPTELCSVLYVIALLDHKNLQANERLTQGDKVTLH